MTFGGLLQNAQSVYVMYRNILSIGVKQLNGLIDVYCQSGGKETMSRQTEKTAPFEPDSAFVRGRAIYASWPEASRGRIFAEPESPTRTCFQRDRDRIIHSTAFRRLKHKTQVFVYHEGDHYRTRLTHSLEVAQIARSISRALGLDEDLAEALALGHDLGHPPFGHAGEDALARSMSRYGVFDHNAQTLRIMTKLEHRYADFDGLNLTWESLEGIVKHNGPVVDGSAAKAALKSMSDSYDRLDELDLGTYPSAEAQVAALSDDIAYNNHDIDDGLRAGLFAVDDLLDLPFVGEVFTGLMDRYPGLELSRLIHEAVRRMISRMIEDALRETQSRLDRFKPETASDVRNLGSFLISFSEEMQANDKALKAFLTEKMYRHEKVMRMTSKAKLVIGDLFDLFLAAPDTLPPEWYAQCNGPNTIETARIVCDFIAGMTDRFAFDVHKRHLSFDE